MTLARTAHDAVVQILERDDPELGPHERVDLEKAHAIVDELIGVEERGAASRKAKAKGMDLPLQAMLNAELDRVTALRREINVARAALREMLSLTSASKEYDGTLAALVAAVGERLKRMEEGESTDAAHRDALSQRARALDEELAAVRERETSRKSEMYGVMGSLGRVEVGLSELRQRLRAALDD